MICSKCKSKPADKTGFCHRCRVKDKNYRSMNKKEVKNVLDAITFNALRKEHDVLKNSFETRLELQKQYYEMQLKKNISTEELDKKIAEKEALLEKLQKEQAEKVVEKIDDRKSLVKISRTAMNKARTLKKPIDVKKAIDEEKKRSKTSSTSSIQSSGSDSVKEPNGIKKKDDSAPSKKKKSKTSD